MEKNELNPQVAGELVEVLEVPSLDVDYLKKENKNVYPISNLLALGTAFEPIVSGVQSLLGNGGSGFYYVNTKGMKMFTEKNSGQFIGGLKAANGGVGGGQALISKISFNPTMVYMAAALMNIEKKLDEIKAMQKEIIDFLYAQEKSKLVGSLNQLSEIMSEYKVNWNNKEYCKNRLITVQAITKEMQEKMILHEGEVQKQISSIGGMHGDKEVQDKKDKLMDKLRDYRLAVYIYAYSSFIDLLLMERFDSDNIKICHDKITKQMDRYTQAYNLSCEKLEEYSKSSIESFWGNVGSFWGNKAGKFIGGIPVISNGPVDEFLIDTGNKIDSINKEKTQNVVKSLEDRATTSIEPFLESLKRIDAVYNNSLQMAFDSENVYFLEQRAEA